MPTILERAVTKADDGTWDFQCPGVQGHICGPFRSTGWPTKKVAVARGAEHFAEHRGEAVTSTLEEFRDKHGLGVHPESGLAVKLEDLA